MRHRQRQRSAAVLTRVTAAVGVRQPSGVTNAPASVLLRLAHAKKKPPPFRGGGCFAKGHWLGFARLFLRPKAGSCVHMRRWVWRAAYRRCTPSRLPRACLEAAPPTSPNLARGGGRSDPWANGRHLARFFKGRRRRVPCVNIGNLQVGSGCSLLLRYFGSWRQF